MNIVDGLSYREWQKRNSINFKKLTKLQQKKARKKGYYNIGWKNVRESWQVLSQILDPINLFNVRLNKGDLVGAIDHSILEAEQSQIIARQAINDIERKQSKIHALAKESQDKYQLL
ncbi:hypothetical protein [Acaryochloris marina]|uniref:hypothetical protein n=1 Tax=Acaryochloris marina TaxID=155978 RepID=UPI001BAEAF7A|nr:hypothetical protein [Acaryochloris marina]QUY45452.1 hypothetical protein I1H34_27125 [Acaryochloris marina S15]